ncbi:hypothetical protein KSP40_PGU018228 [Platanthera guangdongensis]|uniref:Uncharacterized protein n=1 Tax=Platanthera guangdongensis TaxID=2320717 RepID=A0ABR2LGD3_9ASPA
MAGVRGGGWRDYMGMRPARPDGAPLSLPSLSSLSSPSQSTHVASPTAELVADTGLSLRDSPIHLPWFRATTPAPFAGPERVTLAEQKFVFVGGLKRAKVLGGGFEQKMLTIPGRRLGSDVFSPPQFISPVKSRYYVPSEDYRSE